jgi:hypothetical protein
MNIVQFLNNISVAASSLSTAISVIGLITATALPSSAASLTMTGVDCSNSLVTAGGSDFSACAGAFSGNDTGNGNPFLQELNTGLFDDYIEGGTWSLFGKSDEGAFLADQGQTTGDWSLLNGNGLSQPFVISLKASNSFSAYLFAEVSEIIDVTFGTFTTDGVSTNPTGKAQDLSHASIFIHSAPEEEPVELSEASFSPGSLLMFLAGAPMFFAIAKIKKV